MFLCNNFDAGKLPDITIYAGDTTPWNVTIVKKNGDPYPFSELEGSTAVFTLTPYTATSGMGANAVPVEPVLILNGEVSGSMNDIGVATFSPSRTDTLELRGKYVYQIEILNGNEARVGQGSLTIKPNNRAHL